MPRSPDLSTQLDLSRYRKVRRFFLRGFLHALWWDVFLALPGLRRWRRPAVERWCRIAGRYRVLAVEMGGVLIKLGQFLSTRVDVLPLEVTRELAGLQDEVPPEPLAPIAAQIEEDLGRPLAQLFTHLDPEPMGAASLAQVHRARLASGRAVVVKALRPGIQVLVETDLAAIRLALSWLKLWRRLGRRVDLDRLAAEFSATTRRELDLAAEGRSAERFRRAFADDPGVAFPTILWSHTARRTLTMEDMAFIKISDPGAFEAVGVRRKEVARRLYRAYLQQIFVHNFVHADPHPGNLFVRPLPHPDEGDRPPFQPGEPVPHRPGRPFQIVFVDFGMVAEVPERLRQALRSYVMALVHRDARRVVEAYAEAGVLLPGADLDRLTAAHEAIFQRFWGVELGRLRELAMAEAPGLLREYRGLIFEAPFQFPVDLLFVLRAMGILSGLATSLDPEFDPWAATVPFAEELAAGELAGLALPRLADLARALQRLLALPGRLDRVLTRAESGELVVEARLPAATQKELAAIARWLRRLGWNVLAAALLLSATAAHLTQPQAPTGALLATLAAGAFLWGLVRRR